AGVGYRRVGSARARHAVAEGDVALVVHRDGAHPAVVSVGRISTLLPNVRQYKGVAYLVPAYSRVVAAVGVNGVVGHEGVVVAQVAVSKAIHQPVAYGVEPCACARLRDAARGPLAQISVEGSGHQVGDVADEGGCRVAPIRVEGP